MTTSVEIFAGCGLAVDVMPVSRPDGTKGPVTRIEAGSHGQVVVHAGQDVVIREVQVDAVAADELAASPPDTTMPGDEAQVETAGDEKPAKTTKAK